MKIFRENILIINKDTIFKGFERKLLKVYMFICLSDILKTCPNNLVLEPTQTVKCQRTEYLFEFL